MRVCVWLIGYRHEHASLMKDFFDVHKHAMEDHHRPSVCENSCILDTVIKTPGESAVSNSVMCHVKCNRVEADGCVLINVVANRIVAKPGSVIYNVCTSGDITVDENQVKVCTLSMEDELHTVHSNLNIDGGKRYSEVRSVPMNEVL